MWCKLSAEWPMINMDNLVLILDVRFTCTNRETETNRSQVDTVGEYCYNEFINFSYVISV